jgi:hypothetical protein
MIIGKRVLTSERLGVYGQLFTELGVPYEERMARDNDAAVRRRNIVIDGASRVDALIAASILQEKTVEPEAGDFFAGVSTVISHGKKSFPGSGGMEQALELLDHVSGATCHFCSHLFLLTEKGWSVDVSNDELAVMIEGFLDIREVTKHDRDHLSGWWQNNHFGDDVDLVDILCGYRKGKFDQLEARQRLTRRKLKRSLIAVGYLDEDS